MAEPWIRRQHSDVAVFASFRIHQKANTEARPCQVRDMADDLVREREEIGDVRGDRAVPVGDLRVCRLDDEVLVRRVRAAPMAQAEMPSREAQRLAREDVSGVAARDARHDGGLYART